MHNGILILVFLVGCILSPAVAQPDCIDPSLIDPSAFCPGIFAPVCGCNGQTYSNSCLAQTSAGVTTWTNGPCSASDQVPPVLFVPGDLEVECGMDVSMALATATDNSGSVSLEETTEEVQGLCPGSMIITRTFVATDPSGNSTTGVQTIVVSDATPPVWTAMPQDVIVECTNPFEAESAMFAWAYSSAGGAAEDLCSSVTLGNDFDAIPLIDCSEVVEVTVGFYAQDLCGNQSWVSATLTIVPSAVEVEPCEDVAGVDFGFCDAILGVARIDGYCTYVSGCGTDVGFTDYSPAFYSTIEDCVTSCNEGCVSQEYIDLGVMVDCPPTFAEVCGCDGVTYQNACYAQYVGGNVTWTEGPCVVIEYGGCTYPFACNYDGGSAFDDGSCLFPPEHCPLPDAALGGGCTYLAAVNFDSAANWDNGSCVWLPCASDCPADINGDGIVTTADILLMLSAFGLPCE